MAIFKLEDLLSLETVEMWMRPLKEKQMSKIEELRALLAKATPGPWRVRDGNPSRVDTVESGWPIADVGFNHGDAAMIAAMRVALPALLDVVEAAHAWSECVEKGFASELRPDIARAMLIRALRKLDMVPNVIGDDDVR